LFFNYEASAYPVLLEVLNKKCRFFWRLDEIFGTRPNNNPVITADTLPPQEPPSQQQEPPSRPQEAPSHPQEAPSQLQEPLSQLESETQIDSLVLGSEDWPESDAEQESDDRADSARTSAVITPVTSASATLTPVATSALASLTNATSVSVSSTTRTQQRPRPSGSTRRNKGDGELKRLVELNRNDFAEREEKRQKIRAETQIEVAQIQAESQERMLDKQMLMKREESETQMQMQREERELQRELQKEREERQLQMFQGMMASMVQIVTATRSNHTNNDSS